MAVGATQAALLLLVVLVPACTLLVAAQDTAGGSKQPQTQKESLNACLKKAGVHAVTGGMQGVRVCNRLAPQVTGAAQR